ncbi:MAG: MATE family efflux transporter [Spirochaetaceae bacterium]|nr:MATE family efflux transporter [Spirochaetaceae bacterium]
MFWLILLVAFAASCILVYLFKDKLTLKHGLVEGSIVGGILRFSLPLFVGNIFQQFTSFTSAMIVGQNLGSRSVAVMGQANMVYFFLVSLAIGLALGIGILVAQNFGAKRWQQLNDIIGTGYLFTIAIALVITIVGITFTPQILSWLGTSPEIVPMAIVYLRIFFVGTIFSFGYNAIASVLRGVGDSITPLIFLIVAAGVAVGFNLLFIVVFGLGIGSVAVATVLSQAVACFGVIIYSRTLSDSYLHVRFRQLRFNAKAFGTILYLGLPSGLQQSLITLSVLVLVRLVNAHGLEAAAAYSAIVIIDGFVGLPAMTLAMAASTFVGQNLGAGQLQRITKGVNYTSFILIAFVGFVCYAIIIPFRYAILGLFIPAHETEVLRIGAGFFITVAWFYPLVGLMFIFNSALRGLGMAITSLLLSLTVLVGFRIPIAHFFDNRFGLVGVWAVYPTTWALGLITNFIVWKLTDIKKIYHKLQMAKS